MRYFSKCKAEAFKLNKSPHVYLLVGIYELFFYTCKEKRETKKQKSYCNKLHHRNNSKFLVSARNFYGYTVKYTFEYTIKR